MTSYCLRPTLAFQASTVERVEYTWKLPFLILVSATPGTPDRFSGSFARYQRSKDVMTESLYP
jgi:hypothetical protein